MDGGFIVEQEDPRGGRSAQLDIELEHTGMAAMFAG